MNFTYTDYSKIEKMLFDYYDNLKIIETNKRQVEKLQERLENISDDYNKANKSFILNPDMKAVQYDRVSVSGGSLPASNMDRQIDIIFTKIEDEKENLNKQILLSNILIRKLESENDFMEKTLRLLNEESRQIVELRYHCKLSYDDISMKCNISRGNIGKYLKKIKRDLIKWLYFSEEKNNCDKTALDCDKIATKRL